MMIGIIILGVLERTYGTKFPFKNKAISFQELSFLLNIQILFVISMYTTSNSIAVNTLVGLALFQFTSFTFYRQVRLKNILLLSFVRRYFAKHFSFKPAIIQQDLQLHNAIPEITYNYKEFQEPLIEYSN